jgi:hypothetical protein
VQMGMERSLKELSDACRRGDLAVVQDLVSRQPQLLNAKYKGATPLHYAAIGGQRLVVEYLVRSGADLNCADDEYGSPPAGWANEAGHGEVCRYLIDVGTVFRAPQAAAWGLTDALRGMLDADPTAVEQRGRFGTPLHEAAIWGRTDIVKLLLARGVDRDALSASGKTALELAREQSSDDGVQTPIVSGERKREIQRECLSIIELLQVRIGVIGDYNPENETHTSIAESLRHARADIVVQWVPTELVSETDLSIFDGIWCAPQSPFQSFTGALAGIRYAREHGVPFLGTCAGFQHAVIEYARNVTGIPEAASEEYSSDRTALLISRLECSLYGKQLPISLVPGSMAARFYGAGLVHERYYCNFGLNPVYESLLEKSGLIFSGRDDTNEVRVVELDTATHPFFMATLFIPQVGSKAGAPHPLIHAFTLAAVRAGGSSLQC